MIKLQVVCSTTLPAAAAIAGENELLDVIGYGGPGRRTRGCANGDSRLRHLNSLPLALLPGYKKGIDLLLGEVIVIPVEAILEPPERTFSNSAHGHRHALLLIAHGLEFVPGKPSNSIRILPYMQRAPATAGEEPRLMIHRHVLSPSQHGSRLLGQTAVCL